MFYKYSLTTRMINCILSVLLLLTSCAYLNPRSINVEGKIQIVPTTIMGALFSWMKGMMAEAEPQYEFPDTLEGFGYHFNEEGKMRSIDGDEPFKFEVRENDHVYNQMHYEAIGEIITEKVYELLETQCQLQRVYLPETAEENEPRSFVFISEDFYTNKDKLLILIHGNGVVRAGQWARRLIMNDCLDSGTQIPYIKWAAQNGYAVIVANPNYNKVGSGKKAIPIKGHSSPEEHTETMWTTMVQKSVASYIAIVAHSYGGVGTVELTKNHLSEFEEKVFAIAFTDSVHSLKGQKAEPEVIDYYKRHAINWASAYDPLDAPLINDRDPVVTVSAGTDKHEMTSYTSMKSIFKYFTDKYEQTTKPQSAKDSSQSKSANNKSDLKESQTSEEKENVDTVSTRDVNTDMKSEL